MKSTIINFCIKSTFIFFIFFLFSVANLFAVKQYEEQNSKSLNHKIIKSSNSAEYQTIKPREIPVGLNASSWKNIQEQIRNQKSITVDTNKKFKNSKSKIQKISAPVFGAEIMLTASDAQPSDCFGYSVAVAGNVAVVGAYAEDSASGNAGAAYIFERNAGGFEVWGQVKKLIASDAEAGDQFGISVAVAGDIIIVAAILEDTGATNAGAAYIFERNFGGANNWGEVKKLTPSNPEAEVWFGISVAVEGNVAVVGAFREDSGASDSGAAYVFERNSGGIDNWGESKKVTPFDPNVNEWFGRSVAVHGNVVIVGANLDNGGGAEAGAAYIYERNTGGVNSWGFLKKLVASDVEARDLFGVSVAVNNDVAVVGASREAAGGVNAGAAYVFERNNGGANNWGEVKKIVASDAQVSNSFGYSVAIADTFVIVGAYQEASGGSYAGAAYVFEKNSGGANNWGEIKKLVASNAGAGDYFGWSVAIASDVALIGAFYEDTGGLNAGAAYLFPINETKNFCELKIIISSDADVNDWFGYSVSVAGDVAIVGAFVENSGGSVAGATYIFEKNSGGMNNWGEVKKLTASDAEAGDKFGYSVGLAGDVAIAGAYCEASNGAFAGAAYIFEKNSGGANNWGEVKKLFASDAQAGDQFGYSVALAGDVAVVGANGDCKAHIFEKDSGGANNWGEVKKLTSSNDSFGKSVAVNGDVVVVGAGGDSQGGVSAGAAYLFERNSGGANTWGVVKKLIASDAQQNDCFGVSVAVAGNVIVIGAFLEAAGAFAAGAAYIFEKNSGGVNNWGQVKKLVASDAEGHDKFGISVTLANNIAVVGTYSEDAGGISGAGAAYVFEKDSGGANNWGEIKKLTAADGKKNDYFGYSVGISGDIIIAGAYNKDGIRGANAGAAYIFEECIIPEPFLIVNCFGIFLCFALRGRCALSYTCAFPARS